MAPPSWSSSRSWLVARVVVIGVCVAALCNAQPMPGTRAPGTGVVTGFGSGGGMAATSFSSFYSSQKRILVTGGAGGNMQ